MPSLRTITAAAAGFAALSTQVLAGRPHGCPAHTPFSCQNTTAIKNSCCTNTPGGLLLQTQFWDTDPATGPVNSWTVHGLWPDNCDGTYEQYCDENRQYTNITEILQSYNATQLLTYMNKYWKDYQGDDESFWEHEWGKHGTCISTLEPDCYVDYDPQEEVRDYFQRTVGLFQTLPTYKFLRRVGIVPSDSVTYALNDIMVALREAHGQEVYVACNNGAIDEVWYYFNARHGIKNGKFKPAATTATGNCPAQVKYLPKPDPNASSTSATATATGSTLTTSASASPTATGPPFSGSGYLYVQQDGADTTNGCLISAGTWYTTGTCATYTATASDDGNGFTLKSSKGFCAVSADTNQFTCASTVTNPSVFGSDGDITLEYTGSPALYANQVAQGSTQQPVYTGDGSDSEIGLTITWQSK